MPSPTTARGLLGHFPRCADLPAINQRVSPPPVRSPTYLSLRPILAAGAGGGGSGVGSGRRRSPRDGVGGGSIAGGRNRDGRGKTHSKEGAASRKTVATETTAAPESGRKGVMEDPLVRNSNNGAGGKDRVGRRIQE